MTWRKQGPGNRQGGQLGTSQRGPFHAPVPAPLSLTSFRGISPKRESVFFLGTLSPRLSVLPQKWRDEDGELPPPHSPICLLRRTTNETDLGLKQEETLRTH